MGVLREFRCLAHGPFESKDEETLCPYGCNTVVREFRTPPAFNSGHASNIDRTLGELAERHGMSDISNRGGRAAKRQSRQQEAQRQDFGAYMRARYGVDGPGWGNVPKGGTMNVKTQQVDGSGPGAVGAVTALGGRPDNVLEEVRPALVPKPVIVKRDHENLQVSK